jgi:hypothetical protein
MPKKLQYGFNMVVFVSDQHCGSYFGLTPPEFRTPFFPENSAFVFKSWAAFTKSVLARKLKYVLVIAGDMIDGKNRRSEYTGTFTNSLGNQTEIAIEVMGPLCEGAQYVVRLPGTSYHEGFDDVLKQFDRHYQTLRPRNSTGQVLDLDLGDGAILNCKHTPEGQGALYRGTVMDRELLWARVMEAEKNLPVATHLVRAHLHSQGHMRGFGKELNGIGCWKLQDPWAIDKRRYRWIPDIGGMIMTRNPDGFKGWLSTHISYELPETKAENITGLMPTGDPDEKETRNGKLHGLASKKRKRVQADKDAGA